MGASYHSGVVVGVRIEEIGFVVNKVSNRFEVHDKKGRPTGTFQSEEVWKVNFDGQEHLMENLYDEDIENIIGIKPFSLEIININDYDNLCLDDIIIGVNIIEGGGDDDTLIPFTYENQIKTVKEELFKQFGLDIEPKMYFYFYSRC